LKRDFQTILAEALGNSRPYIVVLAGSNGAGKSTFFREVLAPTGIDFVNADLIARSMNPAAPSSVGYEAARTAEAMRQDLVSRRQSFCMETVLSDPAGDKVAFLRTAQSMGYSICLIYIRLDSVDLSRARVQQRVIEGGHDVPDDKLEARFERTRRNAANALQLSDVGLVLDNSSVESPYRHVETWIEGVCVDPPAPSDPSPGNTPPADPARGPTATVTFLTERLREQSHRREVKKAEFLQRNIQTGLVQFVKRPVIDLRVGAKGFQYEFSPQLVGTDGSVIDPRHLDATDKNRGPVAGIERKATDLALQSLRAQSDLSALQFAMFNFSVSTVVDSTFVDWLIATAAKHQIPIGLLCVQCEELPVLDALEDLVPTALRLQQAGCLFSVSRFGSAISSLGYLKELPCAFLNMDTGFVQAVAVEQTDRDIVKAIADLGHTLGQLVIAEGTQDAALIAMLRSLGVDYLIATETE
jgi:predicted ABC-type ATPase/EAL domain-containing protein (putative c-di-GMP-specific phosphodiesterase class I)